jgi:hypothetical protein
MEVAGANAYWPPQFRRRGSCHAGAAQLWSLGHITRMFPSERDIEDFKTEFGADSILHRLAIPRQSYSGLQAAVVIMPEANKDATLARAWESVRAIARWILARDAEIPASERYEVIVGWRQSVRRLQGQIFKVGGDRNTVQIIADSESWSQCGHAPLIRWEKDVFENHVA